MEKFLEPFSTRFGEKITNSLDFNDNKQVLKRKYEVLTSRGSDFETEVEKGERSGKKRRKMEVKDWLQKVEKFKEEYDQLNNRLEEVGYSGPIKYGDRVKGLIVEAEELIKQSDNFGGLLLDICETSKDRLFTTQLHGEAMKQKLQNILARLKSESNQVPSIGIHGMGGAGKTTLARHIYAELQGAPDGFYVCWVTVSEEADSNKLQYDLARELHIDLSKDDDFETKAARLHCVLKSKKKVVIIFDDVWKPFDLKEIGVPLDVDGCKVIITSRSLEVCNRMLCKKTMTVQPLPEEEAWKLFLERLNCVNKLSLEVEEVAKKMAKKCDGLPLAIITVARSMIGVDDIYEWMDALEELSRSIMQHNDMKVEVLPILLYSYNRLRDKRLQECFLYCSMYPEDWVIPRGELIEHLISEGVMHQRDTRSAEFNQGHTIINKLVNSCLLESVGNDKYGVQMHDLLREMAIEITRNDSKYMIKAGLRLDEIPNEKEWTEDLDKVSLMGSRIAQIPEGSSPRCPRLSTLILEDNPLLVLIPDSFFAQMQGLRVLNLRGARIEKLPNSVSELKNLTTLLLGDCTSLFYVPSLRKLTALTELDFSYTWIEKLPEGMECLIKLKCLNMRGMDRLLEVPSGLISQFSRLQSLVLPNHIKVQVEEIESLRMLEEFDGWTSEVCNLNWFNKSPPLTSYAIRAGRGYYWSVAFITRDCSIQLLEYPFKKSGVDVQLKLPPSVRWLVISKCEDMRGSMLDVFPSLSNYRALQNLEQLELSDLANFIGLIKWEPRGFIVPPFSSLIILMINRCHKIKKLFSRNIPLHNLQNLEVIKICNCNQMEEIIADDEEENDDEGVGSSSSHSNRTTTNNNHTQTHTITLPKLRRIHLESLPKLGSIYKGTINCCDSIAEISIENCVKLKRLPFSHPSVDENPPPPSTFPKLYKLRLFDLPKLKSICNGIMICDSIEKISIEKCRKLKRLPFSHPSVDENPPPPSTFPKLCMLRLSDSPELRSICDGIMICDSIDEIYIEKCGKLKRLPFSHPSVDENPPPPSTFPKLYKLRLFDLPELKSICDGIMICDSIFEISIEKCGKLKRLPFSHPSVDENPPPPSTFPKLYKLRLFDLPELKSICDGIMICDSIFEISIEKCGKLKRLPFSHPSVDENPPPPSTFPKLYRLRLCDLPELKSICDGIMICDSIRWITIIGCRQVSRLPLFLPRIDGQPSPPPSLGEIKIREEEREWWESLELDQPNSNNVHQPFLRYLQLDPNEIDDPNETDKPGETEGTDDPEARESA